MRIRCATALLFIVSCSPALLAQISTDQARRDRERERAVEADMERRMFNMRALEGRMHNVSKKDQRGPSVPGEPVLTTETKQRIIAARSIRAVDAERYAAFLKQKHTGIVKLLPDWNCQTSTVIRLGADCAKSVPQSSNVSFRDVGYVARDYRDLGLEDGEFVTTGFFSQGVLVSLGDVPIESLDPDRPEIAAMAALRAAKNPTEARQSADELAKGRTESGFPVAGHARANVGETYALRVIGYKLANVLPPPSERSTMTEMKFLSLALDKRDDIIVAFRVVSDDGNGGLTIVWKELRRKDGPSLKFGKGEALADFTTP